MTEKRRERGFIYRRGWGVVDVGVEVGGVLVIEFEISGEFGFVGCRVCVQGGGRAGWSDLCDLLCAASRYFISITSPSTM